MPWLGNAHTETLGAESLKTSNFLGNVAVSAGVTGGL